MAEKMTDFKSDDVVWVNLGISYGWWPAVIHEKQQQSKEGGITVKFFDDDKLESYFVPDKLLVRPYSGPHKVDLVRDGLVKFGGESKDGNQLGLLETRQSQFVKDVEMAEVMTDNSPEVAEILTNFAFLDDEEDVVAKPEKKSKKSRKRKRNSTIVDQ